MHEINDLEYCVCNVMEDAVIEEESMKERHQEGTSIPFYHFPLVVFASQYPLTLTRNIRYYLIEKIIYKLTLKKRAF